MGLCGKLYYPIRFIGNKHSWQVFIEYKWKVFTTDTNSHRIYYRDDITYAYCMYDTFDTDSS